MFYVAKIKPGAKDIRGKDISEWKDIEFDCVCYASMVLIRNHITKIPVEVPIEYIELIKKA